MWLYVLPSIPVAESEYCSTLTCSSNQLECFGFEGDELARWTFKKTYLFVRVPFPCIYSFPILGVFATSLVFTVKVSSAPELQIGTSAVRSPLKWDDTPHDGHWDVTSTNSPISAGQKRMEKFLKRMERAPDVLEKDTRHSKVALLVGLLLICFL